MKYCLHEKIGNGGYANVYKCSDSLGIRYACKILPKDKNKRYRVQQEIHMLDSLVRSTRVARLIDAQEDDNSFYLILEWCKGGGIKEYLGNHDKYSENTVASIIRGVLRGLCHVHDKGIIHKDIKGPNILFADKTPDSEVKLIDFGASTFHHDRNNLMVCNELVGTPWFMAPEAINHEFGYKSDVWSIGVLAYQMISGEMPFDDRERLRRPLAVFKSIFNDTPQFRAEVWEGVSEEAKDFIRLCLSKEYHDRPFSEEALGHSWLMKTDCADRFGGDKLITEPFKYEKTDIMNALTF